MLALGACVANPPPKSTPGAEPAPAPAASAAIRVHASWPADAKLSAGAATLDVMLVGERDADVKQAPVVLARAHFDVARRPELDVDLGYDTARVDPAAHYVVRAALRDARGRLAAVTPSAIAVTPGDARRVDVQLAASALR